MIISHIIGGLGNQMFQYAVGRSLSSSRGVEYKLDIQDFAEYHLHHGFELVRVFDISAQIASADEVIEILGWQGHSVLRSVLARRQMAWARNKSFSVEPNFNYWPGIWTVPNSCYLMGYWQSEKYFQGISDVIRRDFVFKEPLVGETANWAEEIARGVAVSLHIRRGDYVTNPKTLVNHGLCTLDYYRNAMAHIAAHVNNPCFYVFSDDIKWARVNLASNFRIRFVANNRGNESYRDMQLMSLCRHNIIANSSFSWWGAWLNSHKDKIVIAPQYWFADNHPAQDLIPESWMRL